MENKLLITKPKRIKPVKISSYKELFKALGSMAINGVTLQWGGFGEASLEAISALGLETTEGESAWLLINRAMHHAIFELVCDCFVLFNIEDAEKFEKQSEALFEEKELAICSDFFENPAQSDIVKEMQIVLGHWLSCANVTAEKVKSIVCRLPSFFVFSLNDEWRRNAKDYSSINEFFETPFLRATQYEGDWHRYTSWLIKQINNKVFDESFGLFQIYIPLCGYYVSDEYKRCDVSDNNKQEKRIVVDLEKHLARWLESKDSTDAIRIISGGPGSGKSSFAKIFAANICRKHRVLYIPLHLIDIKKDISKALEDYLLIGGLFQESPFTKEENLLVIFDGLDELTQQGKACVEAARQFVDEVKNYVLVRNHETKRISIIITGREVSVQATETSFRKQGQILYVLPYYLTKEEGRRRAKSKNQESDIYVDESNFLEVDKRDDWWKNYGNLIGKKYDKMPDELRNANIDEITIHPLLNYLVALSFERKKIEFNSETNLNAIYRDLIVAVYERNYASGPHRALNGMNEDNFLNILEEIAISAWHGTGRTTTVSEIEKRCNASGLSDALNQFQDKAQSGVINLLAAFYFRQSGYVQGGEKTFEFTHKSFSEYLVSLRIIRQLVVTEEMYELRNVARYRAWTEQQCLKNWAELCGEAAFDHYIYRFLCNEIQLNSSEVVEKWQNLLCELIGYIMVNGMPYECYAQRPTYFEESRQSRNAEEALMATLSACSKKTKKVSKIEWGDLTNAGRWLKKLQGQKELPVVFINRCLDYVDFSDCCLLMADFFDASLVGANFDRAILQYSCFHMAELEGASFKGALLHGSDMKGIHGYETIFEGAYLRDCQLDNSLIIGGDFRNANMEDANLRNAILEYSDFEGANLDGANLYGANMKNVELEGAKLRGIIVHRTHFEGANLDEAITGRRVPERPAKAFRKGRYRVKHNQ